MVEEHPGPAGFRKALPFYQAAADASIVDAYYALAQIYLYGSGIGFAQPEQGKIWLQRAALGGFDTAQVELGIMLANAQGDQRDLSAAAGWLKRAAGTGNAIAQNRLAHMYAKGIGMTIDKVEAGKWHILASRSGRSDTWLEEFVSKLNANTRRAALAAANRWPLG